MPPRPRPSTKRPSSAAVSNLDYARAPDVSALVRFQNEDLLRKFIEHRVDVNSVNAETGTTALMLASALGYRHMCSILIDAGAELNVKDHSGNTPLHLAAQGYGEQLPVIEMLLERGADVSAVNDDGFTPAVLARRMENDACYRLLESRTTSKPAAAATAPPPTYQEVDKAVPEQEKEMPFSFS